MNRKPFAATIALPVALLVAAVASVVVATAAHAGPPHQPAAPHACTVTYGVIPNCEVAGSAYGLEVAATAANWKVTVVHHERGKTVRTVLTPTEGTSECFMNDPNLPARATMFCSSAAARTGDRISVVVLSPGQVTAGDVVCGADPLCGPITTDSSQLRGKS